jgi:S1-C subfamily serine protease
MRNLLHKILAGALCLATTNLSTANEPIFMDRDLLESIDSAKEPVFSKDLLAFIKRLPRVEQIMAKRDGDIVEEARLAKARLAALLQPGQNLPPGEAVPLAESTGIILMLSQSEGQAKVKGALSCVCIDKEKGLFLTALHPFQQADLADCAVIVGHDGSISGVARTLLRKTEADIVLITTRSPFPQQVRGLAPPPKIGEPLWVSGSCPGVAFFQLGASAARVNIPDWKMLGRLRAKSFDVDRGFPNGLSGGGVFTATGELAGITTRNISVSSHGEGGAALQLGRSVEVFPLAEELQ